MARNSTPRTILVAVSAAAIGAVGIVATPAHAAPVPTATVLADSFSRSVTQGFGAADLGGAYTQGEPRGMSVDGSRGQIALTASTSRSAFLKSTPLADVDVTSTFGVSALPTAGSVYASQMLRTTTAGAFVGPRLRIMPDQSIVIGIRYNAPGGAVTAIGSDAKVPFKMSSTGTRLVMRSQADGSTFRQKVWQAGTSEPSAWTVVGTSNALATPGATGVWTYLGGGTNALTVNVDDVVVKQLEEPNVAPTAAFTSTATDLTADFNAAASNDPDGSIAQYAWEFGDGSTGTGKTATRKYANAGTYDVKLTVTDNRGESDSVVRTVKVVAPNVPPAAAFSAEVSDLDVAFNAGESSDPDGSIENYAWDFGDGTTGTGKKADKHYAAAGTYSVKLTVTDDRGGKTSSTKSVVAVAPNVLPTASFTASIEDVSASFDASTSSDSDGSIVSYDWNFGDGTQATGNQVQKQFAPGDYVVALTVTDNRGGTATTTRPIKAVAPNVLPQAAFESSVVDLDASFDGGTSTDSDGTIAAYAWSFGDGTTGSGRNVTKRYNSAGQYTVTLTVTDDRGGASTTTRTVEAVAPNVLPVAGFQSNSNDLVADFDGGESADSDGSIVSYAWNFGDGTTGSGKTVSKSFAAGGTYSVTLTVTDNRGGSASTTKQLTVTAPNVMPKAAFTVSQSGLSVAVDGSGSSDPDGNVTGYSWSFGDGTTGSGATASKSYIAAGTHTIVLTVTDDRGGMTSTSQSVTVSAPGPVKPSAENTGVPAGTPLTVHNGNLTITTAGTVIDRMDIRGFVIVKAPNVTIKQSIIRGPATAPAVSSGLLSITTAGATGYLVEDVTLQPQITSGYLDGVKVNQGGTFRRVNISGTIDGMVVFGDNVNVTNSYVHDLVHLLNDPNRGGGASHDDAIQVQAGRNVSIIGNTLQGAFNAAVQITQDAGVTQNLKINNNWLDGGGCTLNYKTNGAYKTGMQANDNRFGRAQRVANCAIIHNSAASDLNPTGNVWDDNGQPATIKRGS